MPTASLNGLLVIDKPGGITSRDAVDRAQSWFPRGVRLGHTGTLDPLATGVLVLVAGSATRLTEYVQHMSKTYRTTVRLGARSDTDDAEGEITTSSVQAIPGQPAIEECLRGFLGEIDQVPPAYSAAKVAGRRSYDLARRGEEVSLSARHVRIDGIDVLRCEYPLLELEVRCGKGTYIRSLARDVGERLGCGGHVEVLRRTRVGPFREDGLSLDVAPALARSRLLSPALALAELPRLTVPMDGAQRLRQGGTVLLRTCQGAGPLKGGECAGFAADGELIGVIRVDVDSGEVRPAKILATV